MQDDYERRVAEEQAAKQQFYTEAVGSYKVARVSQLISGEVQVRPPPGAGPLALSDGSGGRGRSPSGAFLVRWLVLWVGRMGHARVLNNCDLQPPIIC